MYQSHIKKLFSWANCCQLFGQILARFLRGFLIFCLLFSFATAPVNASGNPGNVKEGDDIYSTYGTHNSPKWSQCANSDCTYQRTTEEPSDPEWPVYWTSNWNMYRVFKKYAQFPPPYDERPPAELKEGQDYETSIGTTYYDSTWSSTSPNFPGEGAMRESYYDRCLPIFPINNHFSCSFVSLGDTAIFQTYEQDRPNGMPEFCLFSPDNHPPERNFISHLPYSEGDSAQLDNKIQGYSFWVTDKPAPPFQVGVKPFPRNQDGTINKNAILFGYAFESQAAPDASDLQAQPYRHPQSFYFSGAPTTPPNAPIVSQNYTDFSMRQPSEGTWSEIEELNIISLPKCQLFDPPKKEKI